MGRNMSGTSGKRYSKNGVWIDDPVFQSEPGRRPPLVPSIYDDEFDGKSSASWSWVNQGTSSLTVADGIGQLVCPSVGGSDSLKLRQQTPPAGDFTFTARLCGVFGGLTANGPAIGLFLRNSVSGHIGVFVYNTDNSGQFALHRFLSATNWSGTDATITSLGRLSARWMYMRIKVASNVASYSYSFDGVNFVSLSPLGTSSLAAGSWLNGGMDGFGYLANPNGSDVDLTIDHFRVTTP